MPIARCAFCTSAPREEVAVSRWTTDPDDRERLTISLCAKHLKRVQRAPHSGHQHRGYSYRAGFW